MKRHEALVQLSRDHHFGLLLCWKIKEGLKRDVEPQRIAKYVKFFYESHLKDHFAEEEQHIFPVLGNENQLVAEALSQHNEIEKIANQDLATVAELTSFKDLLEKHIRFEERQLFQEIQEKATEEQLENLLKIDFHYLKEPEYEDEFWK